MAEDRNLLDKIGDKARSIAEGLKKQYGIGQDGNPWPQTIYNPVTGEGNLNLYPKHKTRGFLPPVNIEPILQSEVKYGQYKYKDWRGYQLELNESLVPTEDKFNQSKSLPKSKESLKSEPYSTRDTYLIFDDHSTDYFKHGLQVIDKLNPIENPENGQSTLRLDTFSSTPFENNDPIVYGFEIIIDDVSSPLLNGSISDFIRNYSNISEVSVRGKIYEEFKQQFIKFFKTKASVRIDDGVLGETSITKTGNEPTESSNGSSIYEKGRLSYLNYYLKKIDGLENLVERNTPKEKKFLNDYNTDTITLSLSEDVSMSVATLAHLYKLLYWSKPNGKNIIPENLLRFNCDIIVSEVRNFNRVRRAITSVQEERNQVEIIKDNVSRQIYSLRECQFYFNTMPHTSSIDMGQRLESYGEGSYVIQFDYKYATSKLERFMPVLNRGIGRYVGYDSGAIWRVKSPTNTNTDSPLESSLPKFLTSGENKFTQNGVESPFILSLPEENKFKRGLVGEVSSNENVERLNAFDRFKRNAKATAKQLKSNLEDVAIQSAQRELQTFINTRTAILNKTLNKILNSKGIVGIRPPRNIYTDRDLSAGGRIFYDVRGELINFVGGSIGNALGGGGISGGAFSPR